MLVSALVLLATVAPAAHPVAQAQPVLGVDPAYIDRQAGACQDFYEYANGSYDKTPIPPAYASFGVNQEIDNRNWAILKRILVRAASDKRAQPGTPEQRLGDFFASGMNQKAIARAGIKPLAKLFARIDRVQPGPSFANVLATLHEDGVDVGFSFQIAIDDKNSQAMVTKLWQGGLGLPERDYYFRTDATSKKIRRAYVQHVAKMLALSGEPPERARVDAKRVMALETLLAKSSRTLDALRDPYKNYNRTTVADLPKTAPGFDWNAYLAAIDFPASEKDVVVGQPEFLKAFAHLAMTAPLETWKAYLRWQLLAATASSLSRPFERESFDFYGKLLRGKKKMLPRWKRVMLATDDAIGFDLGRLYVKQAFSPEAKKRVLAMVKFHLEALTQGIEDATWMGPKTKQSALAKITKLQALVGYPDKWRDYSALEISRRSYVGNVLAANRFEFQRELHKLGHPVDRTDWEMTPQTNNAYYDPTLNEIVLPAGILQPPFFDEKASDASNYGALASTIGHELLHGFDDQGAQYDANGNLKNWWTKEDKKRYDAATAKVVTQYDAYEPLPGMRIQGHQTLGENLADIGGLQISFEAWKLASKGKPEKPIDGLTPEQQFFVAFAQGWRTNMRPAETRLLLTSDVHSPVKWRVDGPVTDFPEFAKAFHCAETAPMTATKARAFTIW